MQVKAFSPASISLIFQSYKRETKIKSGSIGIGFTVDKGVIVTASLSDKNFIFLNGKKINFSTVEDVLRQLKISLPVKLEIGTDLPLGYGFGISAASALASSYALNRLFNLGKTEGKLARIAHVAEINCKTGLGSVTTQISGGFILKTKPGFPLTGVKFPFLGKKIYAIIFDKLETPQILKDKRKLNTINLAASVAFTRLKTYKPLSFENILEISYQFALDSCLIDPFLDKVITDIRKKGGYASMAMLGKVIISTINPQEKGIIIEGKYKILPLTISGEKTHIIA